MKTNNKIILLSLICSSCLLTASNIESVKDFSKYPITKEVTSISRGGSISDKMASEDGVGTLLVGGVGNDSNEVNNKIYNQTLKNNKDILSDTTNLKDLNINNSDLNVINSNKFVKLNNVNGTSCDDNNPLTVGETYLNDKCQGGRQLHKDGDPCDDGNPQTTNDKYLNGVCKGSVILQFKNVGNTTWTAPSGLTSVKVLVVAGGGGSYMYNNSPAGGAGGGGVLYYENYNVTPGKTYNISVGAGGTETLSGKNSSFNDIIAIGGGAAGLRINSFEVTEVNGGSGGGAGGYSSKIGVGVSGQGHNGGSTLGNRYGGGGGGGAGTVGTDGTLTKAGDGGDGLAFDITGTMTYYGGGGSADFYNINDSNHMPLMGKAGLGGGGGPSTNIASRSATLNCSGKPNTGGGAGSCYWSSGSIGGSGIVVISY